MKAMILAAGLGERMKPLTECMPKPLLMLAGKPLIVHAILRCKMAGITDIVINLCYLGDQIKAALQDGSAWGVRIQYSEEKEPLGMAGGIVHALPLLGHESFIVMSGDVVTDYDFSLLVKKAPSVKHAHLVLRETPPYYLYHLTVKGIITLDDEPKLDYPGFGIFNPILFRDLPEGHRNLPNVLDPYIKTHQITGERFHGQWYNLTTPDEYHALCAHMAKSS